MSKVDSARVLLDSFNSCKHEDSSLAIFEAEQLAARVKKVLALPPKNPHSDRNLGWNRCLAVILRMLDGEDV